MVQTLDQLLVAYAEDESFQTALMDLLADLRHVASQRQLNFDLAVKESADLFEMEK